MDLLKKEHQQQFNTSACVPACLSMVFSMYGVSVSQQDLIAQLGTYADGTNLDVLEQISFERFSFRHEVDFGSSIEALFETIKRGVPVICVIVSSYLPHSQEDRLHAVLVVGSDDEHVYLNDPLLAGEGIVQMERTTFLKAWEWSDFFRLTLSPL